jgi:hypothetical protein
MPCDGHPAAMSDALPGASHQLPRVCLSKPKDVRDVTVCIVERLPKDVRGAFGARQPFQQQQNPTRQGLAPFRSQPGVGARIDRLRHPGSDARLPARACRLHDVDRQSCRRRHEECRSIPNQAAIGHLPPYPDVLHNILGFGCAAQHPVGDAEKPGTYAHERREAVVGRDIRSNSHAGLRLLLS